MNQLETKEEMDALKQIHKRFPALDFGKMTGINRPAKHLRIPDRVVFLTNTLGWRLIRKTVSQTWPILAKTPLTLPSLTQRARPRLAHWREPELRSQTGPSWNPNPTIYQLCALVGDDQIFLSFSFRQL